MKPGMTIYEQVVVYGSILAVAFSQIYTHWHSSISTIQATQTMTVESCERMCAPDPVLSYSYNNASYGYGPSFDCRCERPRR
jgi:hypothetical protein